MGDHPLSVGLQLTSVCFFFPPLYKQCHGEHHDSNLFFQSLIVLSEELLEVLGWRICAWQTTPPHLNADKADFIFFFLSSEDVRSGSFQPPQGRTCPGQQLFLSHTPQSRGDKVVSHQVSFFLILKCLKIFEPGTNFICGFTFHTWGGASGSCRWSRVVVFTLPLSRSAFSQLVTVAASLSCHPASLQSFSPLTCPRLC